MLGVRRGAAIAAEHQLAAAAKQRGEPASGVGDGVVERGERRHQRLVFGEIAKKERSHEMEDGRVHAAFATGFVARRSVTIAVQ